jgi:cytochrome c
MRLLLAIAAALMPLSAWAEMRGHGGPVRAIAISPDGKTAVTGSFDTTVIIWDLERETARQVLRSHAGPVNVIRILNDQFFVSAADDGRVVAAPLEAASGAPAASPLEIERAGMPVIDVQPMDPASPWRISILYADGQRTVQNATTPPPQLDVSIPHGRRPIAGAMTKEGPIAAYDDATIRWLASNRSVKLPGNALTLAVSPDGEIIAGGADGKIYLADGKGAVRLAVEVQELPVTSLALSADGQRIAAAGLRGAVKIIERATGKTVSTLVGPGLPVWSLAFHPDGKTLFTGGADRMVRKWNVATGQPTQPANAPRADFPAAVMNERGAQVFRACEACHTVTPDGGNRAGPTLHGVFGRRIGTAPGYQYSADFAKLPITWNAETITRLFRDGPSIVTPGTKMPEQKVTDPEDLQALVEWLARVTR